MNIIERGIKSSNIEDIDEIWLAFKSALHSLENTINDKSYTHPFVDMVKESKILSTITGSDDLVQNWTLKINNLPSIVLTEVEPVNDLMIADTLGYFYNTNKLKTDLQDLNCSSSDINRCKRYCDKNRTSHNRSVYSLIIINYHSIKDFCHRYRVPVELTIYMTLWHELGHLIFNPFLNLIVPTDYNQDNETVHIDFYKRSKTYIYSESLFNLFEGVADWFSENAHKWSERQDFPEYSVIYSHLQTKKCDINTNTLLAFYFNCLQSSLKFQKISEDIEYLGINLKRLSSYPQYILNAFPNRKIAYMDLLKISSWTNEFVSINNIDGYSLRILGIQQDNYCNFLFTQDTLPSIFEIYNPKTKNLFDDYLLTNIDGLRPTLYLRSITDGKKVHTTGITNDISYFDKPWWIVILMDISGTNKNMILFEKAEQWSFNGARAAAIFNRRLM